MLSKKDSLYSSLADNENDSEISVALSPRPSRHRLLFKPLFIIMLVVFISTVSFITGKRWQVGDVKNSYISVISLDIIPQVLEYQRPFADDPKLQDGDIWDGMFPNNGSRGGYFSHPDIAPKRSTFSAYHQLHCLHAIRQAYYEAMDGPESHETHDPNAHGKSAHYTMASHTSPAHIRHCIDLIRQTLMCYADTTIEEKDDKINGVRGFGTLHQCRDWQGMVKWTEETQQKYGMGPEPVLNRSYDE